MLLVGELHLTGRIAIGPIMTLEHWRGRVDHLEPDGTEMYPAVAPILVAGLISIDAAHAI